MTKKVILMGSGRVESTDIVGNDRMLNYYGSRNQLYEVFPEDFRPMEVYDDMGFLRIDSAVIYTENAIRPYGTGPCQYDPTTEYGWKSDKHSLDWKFTRLMEHVSNVKGGLLAKFGAKFYFTQARNLVKEIMASGLIGFIIVGIVFIQNMF